MSQFGSAERCLVCNNRVYFSEKLSADGKIFHKSCFRCKECKKVLSLGNYASLSGVYYCKPHFKTLFKLKGNYSEGFGMEKPTAKWTNTSSPSVVNDVEEQEKKREEQRKNPGYEQKAEEKSKQLLHFPLFFIDFPHHLTMQLLLRILDQLEQRLYLVVEELELKLFICNLALVRNLFVFT